MQGVKNCGDPRCLSLFLYLSLSTPGLIPVIFSLVPSCVLVSLSLDVSHKSVEEFEEKSAVSICNLACGRVKTADSIVYTLVKLI